MASSSEKDSECNFQSILRDIQLKLNKIECDNGEIKERLCNLELKTGENQQDRGETRQSPASPNQPHKGVSGPVENDASRENIQGEFNSLKDSVQSVVLNPEYKLNENRTNIRRSDLPLFNVVIKNARYCETALKIIASTCNIPEEEAAKLTTVLYAQICYLKDEYSWLLANSTVDAQTAKIYRTLNKHTSGFCPHQIENLRAAASITAARQLVPRNIQQNYTPRFPNPRQFNWRLRFPAPQQDVYQQFQNRQIPPRRSNMENFNGQNN